MDDKEIRLRILEGLLPGLTRLGVNNPENISNMAKTLETYVVNGYKPEGGESDSADKSVAEPKPKARRVRKPKTPTNSEDNPLS